VRELGLLLLVGACGFSAHARSDGGGGGNGSDGGPIIDALPDAPAGQVCFGSLPYTRVCYATANVPTGTKTYSSAVMLDTTGPAECTGNTHALATLPGNPCIVAYATITFTGAGQLTVKGSRPVIFVATGGGGITLPSGAVLNASSGNGNAGPAALASCNGATAANGQSGGFGGSFLELGGSGGLGVNDQAADVGVAPTVLGAPVALHGGCPGGVGGNTDTNMPAKGGGAVALVAQTIALDGLVAAAGDGGGVSGRNNAGGNGGGAGGMIVLDAPVITGGGELNAKGGGGGQGRGGNPPATGLPGYFPSNRLLDSDGGASATSTGGPGGQGGPRIVNAVQTVNTGEDGGGGFSGAGGGGGGGAAGVVIATSPLPGLMTVNPAPQ